MPVLHIHSVDDPRALYAGGLTDARPRDPASRRRDAARALARRRRLRPRAGRARAPQPARARGAVHTATLLAWTPCAGGSEVRLWKLTGGGHGWPGSDPVLSERMMGPRTDVISAAEEIWAFLGRFPQAP